MQLEIIRSSLFEKFDELIFGFSTTIGLNRQAPFFFNTSLTVGDAPQKVTENREALAWKLGLDYKNIAWQKQIHSDIVTVVENYGSCGESDAMITDKKGLALAVSSADCVPVFLFENSKKIIAAVHSGWRGTEKGILQKVVSKLVDQYNADTSELFAYIGPSISYKNYEVGKEVADLFNAKYIHSIKQKLYLDVAGANYDMLINAGIPANQIEQSPLCSFEEQNLLHSFRRDGALSGRAWGVISLKNENNILDEIK